MKPINLFFISALSLLIANNLHFITNNGIIPRALDFVGLITIMIGIYKSLKK